MQIKGDWPRSSLLARMIGEIPLLTTERGSKRGEG